MRDEQTERNTWAVIRATEWVCKRCGESIAAPQLPMRLETYAAMADAFATVHDGCPPPGQDDDEDPTCEVCGCEPCVCDECPQCRGSGWDYRDAECKDVPCTACAGSGEITEG